MKKLMFLTFLAFANLCFSAKLPSTFKKCDKKQRDFNQCLSTAVRDALSQLNVQKKEIGLPCFEPLEIPSMVVGAGTGVVDFAQNYEYIKISGLTKPDSLKARMDFEKKTLELEVDYQEIIINFEYKIKGKILVLPVQGEGPGRLILIKPKYLVIFYLEEYEKKNNKKYYKTNQHKFFSELQGLSVKLENLFNGDKILSDNIHQVMNENWKEVFGDVKSGYEEAFGKIFTSVLSNFLSRVPITELFVEEYL
ncbi:unnamed protein product [Tenebrio molitor]|nr:unnamed protein product [Tenebrio molitor]